MGINPVSLGLRASTTYGGSGGGGGTIPGFVSNTVYTDDSELESAFPASDNDGSLALVMVDGSPKCMKP